MEQNDKLMKNIEMLGEKYKKEYLDFWNKKPENNWWEALKFFFYHSFMRGRRDQLSIEYYSFAIKTLEELYINKSKDLDEAYEKLKKDGKSFNKECIIDFKKKNNIGLGNSIKHQDFKKDVADINPIIESLITPKKIQIKETNKKIYLSNDEDVMMVLDTLKFISENENRKNIYNYIKEQMNNDIKKVYNELISIRAISDKIATFIIRDIGILNPKIKIKKEDYKLAFPIDTWVKQIANRLGCKSKKNNEIKNYLIKICYESKVDPLKVAAGLWFLGTHSLDILLENCLSQKEIR